MSNMLKTVTDLVYQTRDIIFAAGAAQDFKLKGHGDYVTVVDTGVQDFLQKQLRELYPDIQFMGEEKNNEDIDAMRAMMRHSTPRRALFDKK